MIKPFITLCLCIFLFSCDRKVSTEFPEIIFDELRYKLNLPDTVIVNKSYKAIIEFESDFDNIIDPIQVKSALNDTTKTRVITFYNFIPVKLPLKSQGDLIIKDSTFVLNKKFTVENIRFKKTGEFVFCGLIFDQIMHNHYSEKGVRDSVYFERRRQQIFKKVVVINN